jgi:hypothetical protein
MKHSLEAKDSFYIGFRGVLNVSQRQGTIVFLVHPDFSVLYTLFAYG